MSYVDFIITNKSLVERVIVGNVFVEPKNITKVRVLDTQLPLFKKAIQTYRFLDIKTANFGTQLGNVVVYEEKKLEVKVEKTEEGATDNDDPKTEEVTEPEKAKRKNK